MLAKLDYIDGIICNLPVNAFLTDSFGEQTRIAVEGAELLVDIPKKYKKPVVTMKFRALDNSVIDTIVKDGGIPIYNTPEDCARAMYGLVKFGEIKNRVQ